MEKFWKLEVEYPDHLICVYEKLTIVNLGEGVQVRYPILDETSYEKSSFKIFDIKEDIQNFITKNHQFLNVQQINHEGQKSNIVDLHEVPEAMHFSKNTVEKFLSQFYSSALVPKDSSGGLTPLNIQELVWLRHYIKNQNTLEFIKLFTTINKQSIWPFFKKLLDEISNELLERGIPFENMQSFKDLIFLNLQLALGSYCQHSAFVGDDFEMKVNSYDDDLLLSHGTTSTSFLSMVKHFGIYPPMLADQLKITLTSKESGQLYLMHSDNYFMSSFWGKYCSDEKLPIACGYALRDRLEFPVVMGIKTRGLIQILQRFKNSLEIQKPTMPKRFDEFSYRIKRAHFRHDRKKALKKRDLPDEKIKKIINALKSKDNQNITRRREREAKYPEKLSEYNQKMKKLDSEINIVKTNYHNYNFLDSLVFQVGTDTDVNCNMREIRTPRKVSLSDIDVVFSPTYTHPFVRRILSSKKGCEHIKVLPIDQRER